MLKVSKLSHAYGTSMVLNGLSFDVVAGEVLCLLGASGSGKTTCLRLIAGLERVQRGEIYLDNRLMGSASCQVPPKERGLGFVFQDYALFPHMSVAQNVGYGLRGLDRKSHRLKVMALLEEVQLQAFSDASPATLSGGQQQRVALMRALATEPRLILLDEPFSGLDRRMRSKLRDDTLHRIKSASAAAVMVTHDPEEAMFMADKIVLINAGRSEQQGSPAEVYHHPKTPLVADFFGEMNRLYGTVRVDGGVDTRLGILGHSDAAAGSAVQVLIRPEALRLCPVKLMPSEDAPRVIVEAARRVGRSSLVHMGVKGAEHIHLHARLDGAFMPEEGAEFGLGIDQELVYVFDAGSEE